MQNLGKERLETHLDCYTKHDIPNADQRDFPPSSASPTMFIAHWQRGFSMFFDVNGKIWRRAIKYEEAKGWQDIEQYANT